MDTPSTELRAKSLHAALAAIEIYNKPAFLYREETFAILMVNAWELLLKAKAVADSGEKLAVLHAVGRDGKPKLTRSGNPLTHEVTFLAGKFFESGSGLSAGCCDNISLLVEIRDNSIHFMNRDPRFTEKVRALGTASVLNFVKIAREWFGVDWSAYQLPPMPISFQHGFEIVSACPVSKADDQMERFLAYLNSVEQHHGGTADAGHFSITVRSEIVRTTSQDAMPVRLTNDPQAPMIQLSEEEILKHFPIRYRDLESQLRSRYRNFSADTVFRKLMREVQAKGRPLCYPRYLDPGQRKGPPKWFYSPGVFEFFDKQYTRRKAAA